MSSEIVMVLGGTFKNNNDFNNYSQALKVVAKLNPGLTLKDFTMRNMVLKEIAKS